MCALAAFAYEAQDDPVVSDDRFDGLAATIKNSAIPGFAPYTGQWVKNMDQGLLESLLLYADSVTDPACRGELIRSAVVEALDFFGVEHYCCKRIMNNCGG